MSLDYNLSLWNKKNMNDFVINDFFVFIQIPKTSTTNIHNCCIQKKLVKKIPCYRHEGLLFIEQFIENKNIPVYSIVRNPFTQILSYFFHQLNWKELLLDKNLSLIENFNVFVKKEINNVHLRQCDYLKSNKNIKVKIFKFENKDFNEFIKQTYNIDLELNLTNHNFNNYKKIVMEIYNLTEKDFFQNKEIVDLIIKERKKEFKEFNYSKDINCL